MPFGVEPNHTKAVRAYPFLSPLAVRGAVLTILRAVSRFYSPFGVVLVVHLFVFRHVAHLPRGPRGVVCRPFTLFWRYGSRPRHPDVFCAVHLVPGALTSHDARNRLPTSHDVQEQKSISLDPFGYSSPHNQVSPFPSGHNSALSMNYFRRPPPEGVPSWGLR